MAYSWKDGLPSGGEALENTNDPLATLTAVDGVGAALSYGLSGADKRLFEIDEHGVLSLKSALDYEDANHVGNLYSVAVVVHSTDGSPAISRLYVLTLNNANEPVIWQANGNPDGSFLLENNVIGASVADFDATDPDATDRITYELRDGYGDEKYFEIDATTGVLTVLSAFDYENADNNNNRYTVEVRAKSTDSDSGPSIAETLVLTIGNQNEFETEWLGGSGYNPFGGNLDENNAPGQVAQFRASDGDDASLSYFLTGDDATYFSIDERGRLHVRSQLDYEDGHSPFYNVIVNANSSDASAAVSQEYVLTLNDVNEPVIWQANGNPDGGVLLENNAIGASVADFNAIDPDAPGLDATDSITYGLRGRDSDDSMYRDERYFEIDSDSGILTVSSVFDYESRELYTVEVQASSTDSDSGPSIAQTFVLTIGDVNELSTNDLDWASTGNPDGATINENNSVGISLGDFNNSNIPAGESVTYGLAEGEDAHYFDIGSNTGWLSAVSSFDYEDQDVADRDYRYSVVVVAGTADDTVAISRLFVLTVGDVSNTPDWASNIDTGITRNENTADTTLWDFRNDSPLPDGVSITYGLSGEYAGDFTISPRDGGDFWRFRGGGGFDYESELGQTINNRYSVIITANATEDGTAISRTYILTVGDVGQTADWQSSSTNLDGTTLNENNNIGVEVADINNNAGSNNGGMNYRLSGKDVDYLNINSTTGQITVKSTFDYESQDGIDNNNRYSVVIHAAPTDVGEATEISRTFVLTIADVGQTADWQSSSTNLNGTTLNENNNIGVEVADINNNAGVNYRLSGKDVDYLNINSTTGQITVKSTFDYESEYGQSIDNRYSVVIHAAPTTDVGEAAEISRTFVLTVGDVSNTNDWASDTTTGKTLNENRKASIAVAHFDSNGPLPDGVSMTYALTGGDTNYFNIELRSNGLWRLSATSSFDYESEYGQSIDNRYSVIITANATEDGTAISRTYILTIGDVGQTADWNYDYDNNPAGNAIDENSSSNYYMGTFQTNSSQDVTYGLSGENADYFNLNVHHSDSSIVHLRTASVFDYESDYGRDINNRYSVAVVANTTEEGKAISRTFILTINDDTSNNTTDWTAGDDGKTIAENNSVGFNPGDRITDFGNSQPAGINITYGLSGEDANYFNIHNRHGWLFVASTFDYESQDGIDHNNRYSVVVHANATAGESTEISRLFILTIDDVNNTHDWGSNTPTGHGFNENNRPSGLFNFDNDGSLPSGVAITYGISGENTTYFDINLNSGLLSVNAKLDYESEHGQSIDNRYSVIITANATDEGTAISRVYILTIGDVNNTHDWNSNTPTGHGFNENNRPSGLFNFDNDGWLQNGVAITYGISGENTTYFDIDANSGLLSVNAKLDYESDYGQSIDNRYSVIITANADFEGTAISRVYILTIDDVNNTHDWNSNTSAGKILNENRASPITLWDFRNDGHLPAGVAMTYGLSGGDKDYFDISPRDGGRWRLRAKTSFDYESQDGIDHNNRYSVVITANATEEGTAISLTYILTINDVDNTPGWNDSFSLSFGNPSGGSVLENGGSNLLLGDFYNYYTPSEALLTYGLSGDNAEYFNIDTTTGRLTTNQSFDYESEHGQSIDNRYSVIITANADFEGTEISRVFVLTIGDVDYTPVWSDLARPWRVFDSGNNRIENRGVGGAPLATFYTVTNLPDQYQITYGLSSYVDDDGKIIDNTRFFKINSKSGVLVERASFDYEDTYGQSIDNRYSVVVTADANHPGGESDQISRLFILTIDDKNYTARWDGPPSKGANILENNSTGVQVADFDNPSPLRSIPTTYGLSGDHAEYFNIHESNGRLTVRSVFDYESADAPQDNRYSVVVVANAKNTKEGTQLTHLFILTIGDVDSTPDWNNNTPTGMRISEGGITPFQFLVDFNNDNNQGVNVTYELSGGNAEFFTINATTGRLSTATVFDYESKDARDINNQYSVVVVASATDGEGTEISRVFILTIADVTNIPDWNSGAPTGKAIDENNNFNQSLFDFDNVGELPLSGHITYGLSGDSADYFTIGITSGLFSTVSSFDYESEYGQSINNRYSVLITANATEGGEALNRVYILTINNIDNTGGWNYDYDNNPAGKSIEENSPSNYYMGTFQINSSEGTIYTLMGENAGENEGKPPVEPGKNADDGYFKLQYHHSNPDIVHLITNSVFDYESEYGRRRDNRYSVVVVASAAEEGTAISRTFVLTIGDYSNVPYWGVEYKRAIVIENNNPSTLLVDLYNFDEYHNTTGVPEGVFVTYALWGDNAEFFSVTPNEGHLSTKVSFDYESEYGQSINNNYTITIIANKTKPPKDGRGGEGDALNETFVLKVFNDPRDDVDNSSATTKSAPAPVAGLNGKVLFDGDADNIGGISDGIDNEGLIIIGDDLVATQYSDGAETNLVINNVENFEQSFVGYTDADGNDQNHWFFVRDDAGDNTGHIVFDADGLDVNLESLSSGGATTTPDQINLLAGLNFGSDGDFNKPDDLNLDLNGNNAASLTHDQFLALIGGSNNIDFL